jgi:hypothetical protein
LDKRRFGSSGGGQVMGKPGRRALAARTPIAISQKDLRTAHSPLWALWAVGRWAAATLDIP